MIVENYCFIYLPPPPKVDRSYVFTPVRLSICEQNISKSWIFCWIDLSEWLNSKSWMDLDETWTVWANWLFGQNSNSLGMIFPNEQINHEVNKLKNSTDSWLQWCGPVKLFQLTMRTTCSRARTTARRNSLRFVSHRLLDLHPYLNPNLIDLFLSPTQLIHQAVIIHPQLFEMSCYISYWWRTTHLSMVKNNFKKIMYPDRSGCVSLPKSNIFLLVTHPTCPLSFIRIRSNVLRYSCTQSDRQGWKHNLRPPLVAEVKTLLLFQTSYDFSGLCWC